MTPLSQVHCARLAAAATTAVLVAAVAVPVLPGAAAAAALGAPNTWVPTGSMAVARSGQTATLLSSGEVLVAGGGTASAELYDPATRSFSPTAAMSVARTDATATLLPDGNVLVAGGLREPGEQLASAELYDPATGMWSATGAMNVARSGQTATLLPDGEVLVAGGGCNGTNYGCDAGSSLTNLRSAELYDPATGTWSLTGKMAVGRQFHTATLLPGGEVLVAGGFVSCDDDFCSDTARAELYDPATGLWAPTGKMRGPREQQTATLLPDGNVLVAGGLNEGGFTNGGRYSSAEVYDSGAQTWHPVASMSVPRVGASATLLANGWVLVAGGQTAVAEVYEPRGNLWVSPGRMSTARTGQTATLLPGGHVLVTGGAGPDGQAQASAEVYLAGTGPLVGVTPAAVPFGAQQVGSTSTTHSFTVTNDGSANLVTTGVEVTGHDPGDFLTSTDCTQAPIAPGGSCTVSMRFAPTATGLRTATVAVSDNAPRAPQGTSVTGYGGGPDAWVPVGSMNAPREHFTATVLANGKVLVAGGQSATDIPLSSAELYNPATRTFSLTGSLNSPRSYSTATLLHNGEVLVAGGDQSVTNPPLSSAELYDPATGAWHYTASMNMVGYGLTSTLLPSGKVLVTGGNGAEVYDPAAATWTNTGPMTTSQVFATATLLPDGKVLVAGGATDAAELYDPATNAWTATASMHVGRQDQTAALLPDGKVLVAGGDPPGGTGNALASAELYNPATGTWHMTGQMNAGRFGATATLLTNGVVLETGGCTLCGDEPALSSTELFDTSGFWVLARSMTQPRVFQSAALLPGGDVLAIGGGKSYYGSATDTAELYTPILLAASPASGPAGQQVKLTGNGFYAHERVRLTLDYGQVIGHVTTAADGTFTATVTVPTSTAAGKHTLSAEGLRSFAGASVTFNVTG
ncbi:MAG TPA: kelch repeat-containing protein, partial [Streptosporangiaceae bacterium]|nr:kelch repeat-containing protein [Streptosporangiaceae bacterium]